MRVVPLLFPIVMGLRLFAQSPCNTSGPIPFKDHEKWGYLSANGIVISPRFDLAGTFTADGAIACVANECGLLGRDGSFVTSTWNRQSRPFPENYSEGLAPANKDDQWGYVDRTRNVVIPFKFKYAGQFDHGVARVSENDKFFFIDKKGVRITSEFEGAFDFHEGLAAVTVGKNVGYIRPDGSFALLPVHQSASGIDFSEGLAAVRVKGKVGFMDNTGSVIIEPTYDDVYPFSNGFAPVELDGKWGYVDKAGAVYARVGTLVFLISASAWRRMTRPTDSAINNQSWTIGKATQEGDQVSEDKGTTLWPGICSYQLRSVFAATETERGATRGGILYLITSRLEVDFFGLYVLFGLNYVSV